MNIAFLALMVDPINSDTIKYLHDDSLIVSALVSGSTEKWESVVTETEGE